MKSTPSPGGLLVVLLAIITLANGTAPAQDVDGELRELKSMLRELMKQNAEQQEKIERLERRLDAISTTATTAAPAQPRGEPEDALDAALAAIEPDTPPDKQAAGARSIVSRRIGPANARFIDISFDLLTAAGWSSERGSTLRSLQGGAHDPNRRGFTLQQGELSFTGAVDPYFTAEAHVIFGTDFVELEEAFFTTTSLPYNLQLEGGLFFTEFGRLNPTHPHTWSWLDQPVINTRLMGDEGLRSPGASLAWLTPLPWYSELIFGIQNADEGDLTYSFNNGGETVGGRPGIDTSVKNLSDLIYLLRTANSWDLGDEVTALVGFSGLVGSNSTGGDGITFIYGTDLTVKWMSRKNFRGWPFLMWETELMKRDFTADSVAAGTEVGGEDPGHHEDQGEDEEEIVGVDLPGQILRDWGGYTQVLWGFHYPWAIGTRFEYASGSGKSLIDDQLVSKQNDPLRDDRIRFSPLVVYHPTHFSRLRLQYNLDNAKFLDGDDWAHSVWFGAEVFYGAHPAHRY